MNAGIFLFPFGLWIISIAIMFGMTSPLDRRLERIEKALKIEVCESDKNIFRTQKQRIEILEIQMKLVLEEIGKINKEKI